MGHFVWKGDFFVKIGYIRVSTQEQNTMRQEALMEALGVDEVYIAHTRYRRFTGYIIVKFPVS